MVLLGELVGECVWGALAHCLAGSRAGLGGAGLGLKEATPLLTTVSGLCLGGPEGPKGPFLPSVCPWRHLA